MKKKILIILLILIIVLIILVTSLLLFNKVQITTKSIYGTWNSQKIDGIRDGKTVYSKKWDNYTIEILKDNKIKLCYYLDNKKACKDTIYTYENNILSIENNEFYLKGDYEVSFPSNNVLKLRYNYSEGQEDILYFIKV